MAAAQPVLRNSVPAVETVPIERIGAGREDLHVKQDNRDMM